MSASKILVTGSATSSLRTFFTKLATLQTKHCFTLVLALDLFSDLHNDSLELAELLAGKIVVPVQIYATFGGGIIPDKVLDKFRAGEEICTNLTLLGKSGILTLASGLRIASFGGSYNPELYSVVSQEDPLSVSHFTATDLASYLSLVTPPVSTSSLPPVPLPAPDILLTHCYPPSINLLSTKTPPAGTEGDAAAIEQVAKSSRAKYHFVGGKKAFWEREPLRWERADGGGCCRFISLGEMGNTTKDRWFYAFSITPKAATVAPPANSTASPFSVVVRGGTKRDASDAGFNEFGVPNYIFEGQGGNKKGRTVGGVPPEHYTCKICEKKGHWIQECPEKEERDAARGSDRTDIRKPLQPDECWFCLSNPKVTKHLIASIGSETYLTLPKGQLPPTSGEGRMGDSPVPGGGHVLIIPIAHYPTLLSIPKDVVGPIVDEIEKYKQGLKACYASFEASMVSFEVGRTGGKGGHAHIQILPIPNSLADKVEPCFREEGSKTGVSFEEDEDAANGVTENYFKVGLPNGRTLVHLIEAGKRFNLQFGRATIATLLGIQDRADWKFCTKSDEEEKADAIRFKKAFQPFDPSV